MQGRCQRHCPERLTRYFYNYLNLKENLYFQEEDGEREEEKIAPGPVKPVSKMTGAETFAGLDEKSSET